MNRSLRFISAAELISLCQPAVRVILLAGCLSLGCVLGSRALSDTPADAQAFEISPTQLQGLSPEQRKKVTEEMRKRRGKGNSPAAKPDEKKPAKKEDEKKKEATDEKKEDEIKTIKRPTDKAPTLDPDRPRLKPDANGLVQFNYNGHPWAEVLQDYADAAGYSFDWQELPADYLNLTTQRKYKLSEARDILNGRLLARGFTLVVQGEVMSAVKIDKLDPSLVPRIDPDDLEDYPLHDFARVRFQLPLGMDVTKAQADVKSLLSPKAKVIPLLATKRLLVIDSVANLRSVRDLLYAEQVAADAIIKPEVYQIRHRRADYVADQVMIVLGLDPGSRKTPQELQLETQRMQLFMEMQKTGKDVTKMLKKDGPPVHIAVDRQQNRIFMNAPLDLLTTIERTIHEIDVPASGSLGTTTGGRTMDRHKTATASTDAVVTALMELGNLDPLTQLQSDSKSETIFAYATPADHLKIRQMIGKLNGDGRGIHVIWLRRLPARQVAGTLTNLLVGEQKKEDDSRRRRYSWYGRMQDDKKEVGFRAMSDVRKNRLILWANADEMAEVHKMLEQLGESLNKEGRNPSRVRVLAARTPEETARLLERLKAAYPGKLNIEVPAPKPIQQQPQPAADEDKVTQLPRRRPARFLMAQLHTAAAADSEDAEVGAPDDPSGEAPPVNVTIGEDGRIVLSSDDAAALDQLEELLNVLEPPRLEFEKFRLEYVLAWRVIDVLETYFEDQLHGQTESVFDEWGEYEGKKERELGPAELGKAQMLRFVEIDHTNTIVVQGASADQLAVIRQLIHIYDQPPLSDKNYYKRETAVIPIVYSRAQDISKSLKAVYRELLSSKDKEFQDKDGNQPFAGREIPYAFGEVQRDARGQEKPVLIEFEGVLSIGVDEVSNSLVVSARKEVLQDIKKTIEQLDQAATPNTVVRVHRVRGSIGMAERLQKMLTSTLSQPWPGGKPVQPIAKQGGGKSQQQQQRQQARDPKGKEGRPQQVDR